MNKLFSKTILLMLLAIPFLTMSCNNKEQDKGISKLSVVSDDVVGISYKGESEILIEFICDGEWEASIVADNPDWITFKGSHSGAGNGRLHLSVEPNDGSASRMATVSIAAGTLSASVVIKQDGKKYDITFTHPSIAFTNAQFAKLKAAYDAGAPSVKEALDLTILRANGTYDPDKGVTTEQKQDNECSPGVIYKRMRGPAALSMMRAIAARIVDDEERRDKFSNGAVDILYSWALACKDVDYPVSESNVTGSGVFLTRAAWPFFVTYDCLKGTQYISPDKDAIIVAWFRQLVKVAKDCLRTFEVNDYFGGGGFENQMVSNMWGILTIGYALDDAALVQYALDSEENDKDLCDLIQGTILMAGDTPCRKETAGSVPPQDGEIYDRYRHQVGPLKGLEYCTGSLSFLSLAARTCYNNGIDMYAYTAPTGENIRLAYEFYAPFYEKMDSSLQGGYYTGEDARIGQAGDKVSLFEIGLNAYPDSEAIKRVIATISARGANGVTQHDNFGYLRLFSIDADMVN